MTTFSSIIDKDIILSYFKKRIMNFQKAGNVSVVHQVRDVLERLAQGRRCPFFLLPKCCCCCIRNDEFESGRRPANKLNKKKKKKERKWPSRGAGAL